MIHKACPVVLHPDGAPLRHLLLHHPQAGTQLVKGTVNPDEDPTRAAMRELFEESGLEAVAATPLGTSDTIQSDERWHFALCRVKPPVRDRWQHHCPDDGGHLFQFSWYTLTDPSPNMDPRFQNALRWINQTLA